MSLKEAEPEEELPPPLHRLLRPRSIAIVGMSSRPDTAGHQVLRTIQAADFDGEIHLVGRQGSLNGKHFVPSVEALPAKVDLAVFTLPGAAVEPALLECVERQVGGVVLFASGFAELGAEAADAQVKLASIAEKGNIALLGPNCIGFANKVDDLEISFLGGANMAPRLRPEDGPAVALVGQSGGMLGNVEQALAARDVRVSYRITTGNEALLGISELAGFLVADESTSVVAIYAEQIKSPAKFLEAVRLARSSGKTIVLLQSGRTDRAREIAKSHTGSLAGNYDMMRIQVEAAGGIVVSDLDELIDVTELVLRYPIPPSGGVGIVSASGAFGALALDVCEAVGLDVPPLSRDAFETLRSRFPPFVTPDNPLDVSTQVGVQPELMQVAGQVLADEAAIGSILYSTPSIAGMDLLLENLIVGIGQSPKMLVVSTWGDTAPADPGFDSLVRGRKLVVSRSASRSFRAISHLTAHGERLKTNRLEVTAEPPRNLPPLRSGVQPEWLGKKMLQALGIPVPAGQLVKTAEEAVQVSQQIGLPVALKAQASEIAHKTEAGALSLNLSSEDAVRSAWLTLEDNVARSAPGVTLDGMLIERMGPTGLDLMIGAKRDPDWGPLLLVGLGGIWVEALKDTQLLTLDLSEAEMIKRINQLRSAKLLNGFRGSPPVDLDAVASCLAKLAALMINSPEILEIDINPLVALPKGQGVIALDALIVAA